MNDDIRMTTLGAWAAWMRVAGNADSTIDSRLRTMRRLEARYGPLEHLTHDDVMSWLAGYDDASTRATMLSYLRCWARWARREGLISSDPTDRVPQMRVKRRVPRPVPADELSRALALAAPRERLWIELMAWAGLRVSEVAAARPEHAYRSPDGSWWLGIPRSKGGHQQVVALPSWLAERLSRAEPWDVHPQTVTTRVGQVLRAAGSASTPHALRHYYGTAILALTGNVRVAQQALRHADISSTQVYTQVSNRALVEAAEALPRPA